MTCLASIFMTLHYCAYIVINPGLFGHLKYAYRTVMLFVLFIYLFSTISVALFANFLIFFPMINERYIKLTDKK